MVRLFFSCVCFCLSTMVSAQTKAIGTNISSVADWSPEILFVDVFKTARPWISFDEGGEWNSGVEVALRPDGYPLQIPYNDGTNPPQYVRTLLLWSGDGTYPSGDYRLIVSGTGTVQLSGSAEGQFSCPTDQTISVDNTGGGIIFEILSSDPDDPVHDIKLIEPGSHDSYQTEPFFPEMLDFLSDFETIRFMDLMETNFSPVRLWTDRTPISYYSYAVKSGVPYEYLIALANKTQKNPWICIPEQADDDFVRQMAELLKTSLDPDLDIYVEYTNEAWNSIFSANAHVIQMGAMLGYSGQPWAQGWKYYAKRSADIHHIFEGVFGDDDRIINVVSAQAANAWLCNYILDSYKDSLYNPHQIQADVLAIAPYFGGGLADRLGDLGLAKDISVDAILDSLEYLALHESFDRMDEAKDVADQHGVELIAYEGGQHLVSYSYRHLPEYINKLAEVNRHTRMQDLYCQYFDHWYNTVRGGLFCHFSSHGRYTQYGYWGVKEHMWDSLAPKYLALKNCVFEPVVSIVDPVFAEQQFRVYPNPALHTLTIATDRPEGYDIRLYNMLGQQVDGTTARKQADQKIILDVRNLPEGLYLLEIESKNAKIGGITKQIYILP